MDQPINPSTHHLPIPLSWTSTLSDRETATMEEIRRADSAECQSILHSTHLQSMNHAGEMSQGAGKPCTAVTRQPRSKHQGCCPEQTTQQGTRVKLCWGGWGWLWQQFLKTQGAISPQQRWQGTRQQRNSGPSTAFAAHPLHWKPELFLWCPHWDLKLSVKSSSSFHELSYPWVNGCAQHNPWNQEV